MDTNIFQMTINNKIIVNDLVSAINDIIESMYAIYIKILLLSLFNDGGRYAFDT